MTTTIETPHRNESGLTPTEEARMLERAMHPKHGWLRGQRFPTREPKKDLDKRLEKPEDTTPIDKAMSVVHSAMDSPKMAAKVRGANIVRLMEFANQKDDVNAMRIFDDKPVEVPPVVNQQINITIEKAHEDDEYLEFRRAKLLGHSFKPGAHGGSNVAELASGTSLGATG